MLGMCDLTHSMNEFAQMLASRTLHALTLQPWHLSQYKRVLSHFQMNIRFPKMSNWTEYEKGIVTVVAIYVKYQSFLCSFIGVGCFIDEAAT